MTTGVVAHLFWAGKVLLILRDQGEGFADPGLWDSVTETLEPGEDLEAGMRRGLEEEICMVPGDLRFLGLTRAGHGFFVGVITDAERHLVRLGSEGVMIGFVPLEELSKFKLGGALRNHLEAYPQAFEKMSRGIYPEPHELGLSALILTL